MTKREIFETLNSLPFDFQICGSLGLKLMGIITREIGDIDILVEKLPNLNRVDTHGSDDDCATYIVNGIKVNAWCKWGKFTTHKNNFGEYKVALPGEAIKAKIEYIENLAKWIEIHPDRLGDYSEKIVKHASDLVSYSKFKS